MKIVNTQAQQQHEKGVAERETKKSRKRDGKPDTGKIPRLCTTLIVPPVLQPEGLNTVNPLTNVSYVENAVPFLLLVESLVMTAKAVTIIIFEHFGVCRRA